jgi:hypothetical protein
MQIDFEAIADHPYRIMDAWLFVEDELLWEQVQDFAIRRKRNRARAVDSGANIFARDFPEARAQADAASAVEAAHMWSADAYDAMVNDRVRYLLSFIRGMRNSADGGSEFSDKALAHSPGRHLRMAAIAQGALMQFSDQHPRFCAADVENRDEAVVLLRHS